MAMPHPDRIQDSEGATPAKTMPVQHQQASEGGPVPIQELRPQRQLDHVHTSVNVTAYATAANATDAPLSITIEHPCQAKYLSAKHQERMLVALTPAVSPYAMRTSPVMKMGQEQLLHATTKGIHTQLQAKLTSQVLGNIPALARIHRHNSYILKGKPIKPPVRLMHIKRKHRNWSTTGLRMFKVSGTGIQLPDHQ